MAQTNALLKNTPLLLCACTCNAPQNIFPLQSLPASHHAEAPKNQFQQLPGCHAGRANVYLYSRHVCGIKIKVFTWSLVRLKAFFMPSSTVLLSLKSLLSTPGKVSLQNTAQRSPSFPCPSYTVNNACAVQAQKQTRLKYSNFKF